MATEVSRKEFGETPNGFVVVVEKQSFTDDGEKLVSVFEVKHGVRTVGEYKTRKGAEAVAGALVA